MISKNDKISNGMKIVTVIPLKKGPLGGQSGNLTYFSSKEAPVGSIVSIPFRSKKILGLVVEAQEAREAKSDIKEMAFDLRRVIDVKEKSIFLPEYLEAATEISKYFAAPPNLSIASLIPALLREEYDRISKSVVKSDLRSKAGREIKTEKLILQEKPEDRLAIYKTLIRESFALKKSIFIVLPTKQDVKNLYEPLAKGIEQFVFALHSGVSKKSLLEILEKVVAEQHGVLILATAPFLSIPREDTGTIIIEHESSPSYRSITKPHIDFRPFIELFASKINAKLVLADTLLRFETIGRREIDHISPARPLSFRVNFDGDIKILSKKRSAAKEFKVLSDQSIAAIKKTLEKNKNVFIFSLRKGVATVTACRDCGETLACDRCLAPVVLYNSESGGKRIFICNRCQKEFPTDTICATCGSWNLMPLGIGTDTVLGEVKKIFPKNKIFKLDKESVKNASVAQKIIKDFNAEQGSILIGTELALFYLTEAVPLSLIASFDSLWSIPNFRMNEKIVGLILSILKNTSAELIIETKNIHDPAILAVKSGNLAAFVREELSERKNLKYPPYKRFIKITHLGDKEETKTARELLAENFKEYEPEIYSGFHPRLKGRYVTNALLKLDPKDWSLPELSPDSHINENLLSLLLALPRGFEVFVDPEDLL